MADADLVQQDPTELVTRLEEATGAFEQGLVGRLANLGHVGEEWTSFQSNLSGKSLSPGFLLLECIGTAFVTYALFVVIRALLRSRSGKAQGWKQGGLVVAATVLALLAILIATRFAVPALDLRHTLRTWGFAAAIFCLIRAALMGLLRADDRGSVSVTAPRENRFRETVSFAILWALVGISISATLRIYQAGPGFRDLFSTVFVVIPVTGLLAYAYWRHRTVVRTLIASPETEVRRRRHVAAAWPWIAIAVLVLTVVASEIGLTLNRPLSPLTILLTLILVLIAPHLDGVVARWSERGMASPDTSIVSLALRRTTRFVIAVGILCLLVYLWVVPLLAAFGVEATAVARSVVEIGLIALAAALLWNAVGALVSRVAQSEDRTTEHEEESPRTRLGTLLPLLSSVVKMTILAVTLLTFLVAVGINVWPIIGGLSIFGIAIGFGSQTLVKDVVSGLFFLVDDAFRLGEYIETPGAKGTVEKISVRSVSLRNSRGALASVPYGQIGKVINFSRGWVIEKLVFRVAFDTDVEQVRKLFKTIGQQIAEDPELSPDLLESFKSQGISAVEDGTLIIRGKFKARAGKQFAVKKAVLTAVQKAFRENNIKAVPKPLSPMTGS